MADKAATVAVETSGSERDTNWSQRRDYLPRPVSYEPWCSRQGFWYRRSL